MSSPVQDLILRPSCRNALLYPPLNIIVDALKLDLLDDDFVLTQGFFFY